LEDEGADRCHKLKFHAHVARDTLAVFLVIQLAIIVLGLLMSAIDVGGALKDVFPQWVSEHSKTSYYIWGFIILLAVLGVFGLISLCTHGAPARNDSCGFCYCGDCGDCRCHGSGGGDDAAGCLVVVLVIIVVLAFIGFFVGIFLASLLMQKIVQRHYRILWLKSETKKFRVVDLDGRVLPEQEAVAREMSVAYPTPSAPQFPAAPKVTYPVGLY
jgi:ABC-type phosphate transport system permease subunit